MLHPTGSATLLNRGHMRCHDTVLIAITTLLGEEGRSFPVALGKPVIKRCDKAGTKRIDLRSRIASIATGVAAALFQAGLVHGDLEA